MGIVNEHAIDLTPQRQPFVMVDRLIYWDEERSRTTYLVEPTNILYENGRFSEAGLTENMAQTAAAGAGYAGRQLGQPVAEGYIGAIQNLEIFSLPRAGETIETEVIIENLIFDVTMIVATVKRDGKLLASCKMKIFLSPEKPISNGN